MDKLLEDYGNAIKLYGLEVKKIAQEIKTTASFIFEAMKDFSTCKYFEGIQLVRSLDYIRCVVMDILIAAKRAALQDKNGNYVPVITPIQAHVGLLELANLCASAVVSVDMIRNYHKKKLEHVEHCKSLEHQFLKLKKLLDKLRTTLVKYEWTEEVPTPKKMNPDIFLFQVVEAVDQVITSKDLDDALAVASVVSPLKREREEEEENARNIKRKLEYDD